MLSFNFGASSIGTIKKRTRSVRITRAEETLERKHPWELVIEQKTRAVADSLLEAWVWIGEETNMMGISHGGPTLKDEFHHQDLKPMVTVCNKENLLWILARGVVKESF